MSESNSVKNDVIEANAKPSVLKGGKKSLASEKTTLVEKSHAPYLIAGIVGTVLVAVLTVATFFQNEYEAVIASLDSDSVSEKVADETLSSNQEVEVAIADAVINDEIAVSENAQPDYIYKAMPVAPVRTPDFNAIRQNQRASYEEAMRRHNARNINLSSLRAATFAPVSQNQNDMQRKMETLNIKTQQIQLEMQQKMQAIYEEFHSI